jgi:hypothetical protein
MTENEKLKALLAKSRRALSTEKTLNEDTGRWEWTHGKLAKDIDAALAEPVTDDCEWHSFLLGNARGNEKLLADIAARAVLTNDPDLGNAAVSGAAALRLLPQAERERDEARAEVERLRGIAMHPTGVTWARYHETVIEIMREEAALDYKAGAEAMREAAAEAMAPMLRSMLSRIEAARAIRALPIPEDKP